MMVEAGQAAIIRTTVTLKLIVLGGPDIGRVHGGKYIAQPIKAGGQITVINMNRIQL